MPIQSKNPATLEVIKTYDELSESEVEAKLVKAEAAFAQWRQTSFKYRAGLFMKLAEYLEEHKVELGKLAMVEMGKTVSAAGGELTKSALTCEYYAENAETYLSEETIATASSNSFVRFDPLGILLAVMPWNFPYWQVYRFAAPSIMAGNVAVLKHASNVPACAEAIEKSFLECGFPEGVFQNLALGSARVEKLIRDPRIKGVALTGSEKAGSEVASVAGSEIKKTVLELGGSDPFIVFADGDIELAAKIAFSSRISDNVGQACNAAKRFIVHKNVSEEFSKKLIAHFETIVVGDPSQEGVNMGPLAGENILKDVKRQVDASVVAGAKVLFAGKTPELPGYFYAPTILSEVKKGMPVYDEEVFGPVAPIISFTTEDEAINIANDSEYGLGATIITANIENAKKLASKIEAGNVFINEQVRSDPRLPFGGIKRSGYGRELSTYGIKEFVNIKTVSIK